MLPSGLPITIYPPLDLPPDQARLARRLHAWLVSQPAPGDILENVYQVARCLDDSVPGGLRTATADVFLEILCTQLLYCGVDDFMAAWPTTGRP